MVMALSLEERNALNYLGVSDCDSAIQLMEREDLIKKNFRKRALNSHPDRAELRGVDPERMERAFHRVNESYQILMERITSHKRGYSHSVKRVKVRPANSSRAKRNKQQSTESRSVTVGYYKGPLPKKTLRFGEYLYYKQNITWEQLISALSWQFINRPKLGEIARKQGWLSNSQIVDILRAKKSHQRFGVIAVRQGLLSVERCKQILRFQRNQGLPIGKYFIDQGILSSRRVGKSLFELSEHNNRFKK